MKVFGKEVFSRKKVEELYDFAQHGLLRGSGQFILVDDLVMQMEETPEETKERQAKLAARKHHPDITPRDLYELKSLNISDMQLNCDPLYIEEQARILDRKADLIIKEDSAKIQYGKEEVRSLALRMRNRSKYANHKIFFDAFAYTTSAQIVDVVKGYKNLRTKRVEEFVPDLPVEAITLMEQYNEHCRQICGKNTVFYIIADKKDFEVQVTKRDPVLLAQSPFGLVWQILGAWDEEMVLLDEL